MEMETPGGAGNAMGAPSSALSQEAPGAHDRQVQEERRCSPGLKAQGKAQADLQRRVQPQSHQAHREPARELRPMPGLQDQVALEQGVGRVGTLHRSIQFLTVATAFLSNCLGSLMGTSLGAPGLRGRPAPRTPSTRSARTTMTGTPSTASGQHQ